MTRIRHGAALGLLTLVVTACPAQVEPAAAQTRQDRARPMADEKDPRVVRDGEDLYPAQTLEAAEERSRPTGDNTAGLGSGRPDETNGTCRLYAPKLAKPECCGGEFGFDVESIRTTCGLDVYLGESFQESCGYYFHQEGQSPTQSYFRMKFVEAASPKAAADNHDAALQGRIPGFASTPIPGVPGALWSDYQGVHWAFLPGWDKVRQLTWRDNMCSAQQLIPEIQRIIAATAPPDRAPRTSLVPKRRG
jgi:hypothetical protein